ncbi:ATP-binding protein [Fontivita pretiosa]|uniref:sensor histidine kinase n=1 Tax=Fontivita pretiosa TaxID=2989684 RepID=UPI003D18624E
MSPRSIVLRLILPFAMMIVVVVGVCGTVVYWSGQQHLRLQQIQDLDRLTRLLRQQLNDGTMDPVARGHYIHGLGELLRTRITLIDGGGGVIIDTHADPATMDNHNTRPEVIEARKHGVGSSVRRSDTTAEPTVYVAQLLDRASPQGMVIRLSYPRHVWARLGIGGWAMVAGATVSAGLVMIWLAVSLQRQWIGPVRALAAAADRVAAGEWHTRLIPDGADELRILIDRFNVMAEQLHRRLAELQHQRADLQALVDALPDPVLLGDQQQRIVVINSPAARLFQIPPGRALGEKLVNVVNEASLLSMIEELMKGDGTQTTTITRQIRLRREGQRLSYQAVVSRAGAGGVLLVLRDVTALASAVQMKTDFVANASHELRTPIAAIKAAFETLRDVYEEDPSQSARCIRIIDGHIHRLEQMLADLLDLSRVESPDLEPRRSPLKVSDLTAFVRATFGPAAQQRGLTMDFVVDGWDEQAQFVSDQRLVHLILKNLVENAVKFTPPGGKITVGLLRKCDQGGGEKVLIRVQDTGVGIAPEHQQRVFERFYQVDPARSGAAGRGTGLGLAIVKHAVHALGGEVSLSSEVGVGTTVSCVLPQAPT